MTESPESRDPSVVIAPARDDQAEGLIELIGGVFDEYPGMVTDVDGEMPELRAIATAFAKKGGEFWTATVGARVVGCVGYTATADPERIELKKLYVAKDHRRRGLAARLCDLVEDAARHRGASAVELWSDVKFEDAHRFYQRRGYQPDGRTRELHDLSDTVEYYFRRDF